MSELLGKSDSLENAQPTLLQAYQPLPQKEPGHACKGEDRCCGGCRNPKRPVAPAAAGTSSSSNQETARASSEPSPG